MNHCRDFFYHYFIVAEMTLLSEAVLPNINIIIAELCSGVLTRYTPAYSRFSFFVIMYFVTKKHMRMKRISHTRLTRNIGVKKPPT